MGSDIRHILSSKYHYITMQTQYCNIATSASQMYSERTYSNISTLYYVSQEYMYWVILPEQLFPTHTHTHIHTNLVHMSPVLAVVIEALPHHAHDFREGHNIVGQISNL